MTQIDIYSGFLGAGKTTLIRKLLADGYQGQKLVLIENEFGEIGIDGGFLQDAGVVVNEMNAGCICCSLTGDFREALKLVVAQYAPDRILIEPSGVGKLSEIAAAVEAVGSEELAIGGLTTVADAGKVKLYMKNFGEFYNDQIAGASCIVLSRTQKLTEDKLQTAVALLREKNPTAVIVTTPWDELSGEQLLAAIHGTDTLASQLEQLLAGHEEGECDDPDCCCHHHHHEHDHEHEHEHHHEHEHEHEHHHDHEHEHEHEHHHEHEHEHDHDHEHHHDHDHEHDHEHHHHHGHDADEVFQSWGMETAKRFTPADIDHALDALEDEERFGLIIRAKGYVPAEDGSWIHFDYTPGEKDVRTGPANVAGRLCVIGAGLKEDAVKELFGL